MDAEKIAKDIASKYSTPGNFGKPCRDLTEEIAQALTEARNEEREKVVKWMMSKTLATGHGDTIEELLEEIPWQIREKALREAAEIAESEIELHDDIPEELFQAIRNDKETLAEAIRIGVKLTKKNIADGILRRIK